ncbi:LysE/ArgO family amino acid transporter [Tessaracoccus caeni]|uniref:LysE/ArgO family amino acid transporter n=1 Tax=Tessaracoccus caeni TaxID=3031239 RepID=UPI0023DADC77|nr:LysE family transporter [Tessaracoccus caeni]MDF1489643.1 LysE family transporter [Tessaracoccus caeni]
MLTTALAGFGFLLSLIVAIGAQNAFVLRQGLRREHVGIVVAICAISDAILIAVGTAGVGAVVAANQTLLVVVTVLGAGVLLAYAVAALRRAARPQALVVDGVDEPGGLAAVTLTAVALTWLNPHVYLDTVVLLGSVASTYSSPWTFAAGAMTGSVLWFAGLGFGAGLLRPLFAKPVAWRIFDLAVAVIMIAVAVGLLLGLAG